MCADGMRALPIGTRDNRPIKALDRRMIINNGIYIVLSFNINKYFEHTLNIYTLIKKNPSHFADGNRQQTHTTITINMKTYIATTMISLLFITLLVVSVNGLQVRSPAAPCQRNCWYQTNDKRATTITTTLHLLKGLEPTVDDDIRREVEEANISNFDLFKQQLDEGNSIPEAISTVMKRRKDKAGDYENKYKILSDYRSYSNKELLDTDHFLQAPTLDRGYVSMWEPRW